MSTGSSTPSQATTTTPTPLLPDDGEILTRLEKSVRQGDWNAVSRLTNWLKAAPVPSNPVALAEHLHRLQSVLVSARVGRASLAVSLTRARAAASFTQSRF
jgi:hypothetical protein